jgi:hypothetical protein
VLPLPGRGLEWVVGKSDGPVRWSCTIPTSVSKFRVFNEVGCRHAKERTPSKTSTTTTQTDGTASEPPEHRRLEGLWRWWWIKKVAA